MFLRHIFTATVSTPPSSFDPVRFPVRLNDSLNSGQYTILRRLGQRASSSSWLVRNNESESDSLLKYQVLKILTTDATQRHDTGIIRELELMQEIEKRKNDADFGFLPLLRNHFVEQGPKGKHLCLVQDLYSTPVSSLRRSSPTKTLPFYTAKKIISMVVDALAQLHAMQIIHTNVKPDNIFLSNSSYSTDDKMQRYLEANPTEFEGQAQLDGETYPIFKAQPIPSHFTWDASPSEVETMLVSLTDLGNAQRAGEQPTVDFFSAYALRAPETIIRSDFGSGVDIWAVGCITFELLIGRWMFHPREENSSWKLEDDHLAQMMECTGETFPTSMLERARLRKEYFDDAGNLLRVSELTPNRLEDVMKTYNIPNLSEDEIESAADFIRACLKFDYNERASAEELKKHKFLADRSLA